MNKRFYLSGLVLLATVTSIAQAATMTDLRSFENIEEPQVKYIVPTGQFERDTFVNITDVEPGTVRMSLRFRPNQWWDGDRETHETDRQRAEVKGLGPHQKDGDTFEYVTTWRTDPDFAVSRHFCHVFQLKATDGDKGAPLVVLSILSPDTAAVRLDPGNNRGFTVARKFAWKPGAWQTVAIRIKTSTKNDGEVAASIDGDEFQGIKGVAVYRPSADDYRPKWGLYRGVDKAAPLHDDYVEHKNVSVRKLP